MHKLSTPWEGPFMVVEVTRPTSYGLAYLDGTSLPNSSHIDKLRQYSTSVTITFLDKLLKGTQHDSVIHHSSKFIYSAQNHGSQNSDFITNFIYKVYSEHPSGRLLVYYYTLLYEPTARVARPHEFLVPPKGSGPPTPGWSRPQALTAESPSLVLDN